MILPVVICLCWRLSHACPSWGGLIFDQRMNRDCGWLNKSVVISLVLFFLIVIFHCCFLMKWNVGDCNFFDWITLWIAELIHVFGTKKGGFSFFFFWFQISSFFVLNFLIDWCWWFFFEFHWCWLIGIFEIDDGIAFISFFEWFEWFVWIWIWMNCLNFLNFFDFWIWTLWFCFFVDWLIDLFFDCFFLNCEFFLTEWCFFDEWFFFHSLNFENKKKERKHLIEKNWQKKKEKWLKDFDKKQPLNLERIHLGLIDWLMKELNHFQNNDLNWNWKNFDIFIKRRIFDEDGKQWKKVKNGTMIAFFPLRFGEIDFFSNFEWFWMQLEFYKKWIVFL